MKRCFWIFVMILLFLSACTSQPNAIVTSTSGGNSAADTLNPLDSNDVKEICYYYGGGMPPDDEHKSTSWYSTSIVFSFDGKVKKTECAYDRTILLTANWKVSTKNFKKLVESFNKDGFTSLPETFAWGAFDANSDMLSVTTKSGKTYRSGYSAGFGSEDNQSYDILSKCLKSFIAQSKETE